MYSTVKSIFSAVLHARLRVAQVNIAYSKQTYVHLYMKDCYSFEVHIRTYSLRLKTAWLTLAMPYAALLLSLDTALIPAATVSASVLSSPTPTSPATARVNWVRKVVTLVRSGREVRAACSLLCRSALLAPVLVTVETDVVKVAALSGT